MYQCRETIHDGRRSSRCQVTVVACRSEKLAPIRAPKMELRTRIRASAWSTKGWSFKVPVAYFGSVLQTEGARGEAITWLLVAVHFEGIFDWLITQRGESCLHVDVLSSKKEREYYSLLYPLWSFFSSSLSLFILKLYYSETLSSNLKINIKYF